MTAMVVLFFTCILQNASFTFTSRARNSGSYAMHALAGVFSNGIWFANIGMVITHLSFTTGVVYVAGAVTGSVGMHWLMINYIEKGNRKVGYYAGQEKKA